MSKYDGTIKALAKYFGWDVKSEQSREIRLALESVESKTLDRVEKAGCAHACAPPCPFNRKMASLRTQHDYDPGAIREQLTRKPREESRNAVDPGAIRQQLMRQPGCTCSHPANPQAGHQGMCPLRTQDASDKGDK
jgi:hypothetical protein